ALHGRQRRARQLAAQPRRLRGYETARRQRQCRGTRPHPPGGHRHRLSLGSGPAAGAHGDHAMMKDKRVWAGAAVLIAAAFWFYIKPHFFDSAPPPVYTDEQIAEAPRPTIILDEKVFNLKAPANAPNYVK